MRRRRDLKLLPHIVWLIAGGAAFAVVAVDYYRVHDISIVAAAVCIFCVLMGVFGLLRNSGRS